VTIRRYGPSRRYEPSRRHDRGRRRPAILLRTVDLHARLDLVASTPVVSVEGVIDLATLPELHSHLLRAVTDHPGTTVVVDLDAVTALDDCGLGIILGAAGRARESGGDLNVVASSERLRQRFRSTGLDRAIEVRERL
jgi:anti-sigma B factor antagonist